MLVGGKTNPKLVENVTTLFTWTERWFIKNILCLIKEKTNTIRFRTKLNKNQGPDTIVVEGLQFSVGSSTSNKLNKICFCMRNVLRYT